MHPRVVSTSFAKLETLRDSRIDTFNYEGAVSLLKYLVLEKEFSAALLYVGKAEERETHVKIVALCKQVSCSLFHFT